MDEIYDVKSDLVSEIQKNKKILNEIWELEKTIRNRDNEINSIRKDLGRLNVYDNKYGHLMIKCNCRVDNYENTYNVGIYSMNCNKCNGNGYYIKEENKN